MADELGTVNELVEMFNDGTQAPGFDEMPTNEEVLEEKKGDEGAGELDEHGNPVVKEEVKPELKPEEGAKPDAEYDTVKSVLEKHGISAADLNKALAEGKSLKEVIGDRDAKSLVAAADKIRQHEAEEVIRLEKELEDKESPEDTITRLKQKNLDLQNSQNRVKQDEVALADSRKALETLNKTLVSVVDGVEGLDPGSREIALLLLGSDNPINDVDIDRLDEVKTEASSLIAKLTAFRASVAQQAVDDYVKGKGKVLGKEDKIVTDVKGKVVVPAKGSDKGKPKPVSGAQVNRGFQDANDEMMAIIKQAEAG